MKRDAGWLEIGESYCYLTLKCQRFVIRFKTRWRRRLRQKKRGGSRGRWISWRLTYFYVRVKIVQCWVYGGGLDRESRGVGIWSGGVVRRFSKAAIGTLNGLSTKAASVYLDSEVTYGNGVWKIASSTLSLKTSGRLAVATRPAFIMGIGNHSPQNIYI